jgi:hypothetical protein
MAKAIRELSLSIYGIKLTPPLGSLLWWFVRKQEALLVLNDLERMEGLPLAQIMGLASSLTENSPVRLKVILVCNSERFQVDDQQNLATYREKVIHSELLYNPSPEEIVEQFFHQPRERAAMVECLRQSGQANIRIVIRVADALSQVSELFRKRGVELRGEDRECIVRTAAFYYLAGRSISAAYLEELASREYGKMMEAIVRPLTPTPDKTIPPDLTKELAKRLRVSTSNKLVPVVIGWIENGNVPEAELQPIVEWKKFEAASYRLRDREKDALGFLSDFRDVEPTTAISGLKSFLTLSHQEARLGTVMQFQGLLSELGETDTDWITKHVEAVISGFNEDQCRSYLRDLSTHSASAIVQARLQALGSGRNLKDVIWRMAGGSGWNNGDWEFLASKSADDYEAWLLAEDAENMRYMVRGLLQLGSLDGANPQGMAKRNLITALNRLRGRSIVQKLRLIDFPTELAAEETQGQ